jgi:pimeloyl-ACP methyl ester carboxylesterase
MKRLISGIALCCLLASCADSGTPATTTSSTPSSSTTSTTTTTTTTTTVATTTTTEATTSTAAPSLTERDVTFASGDLELAGTLRLPEGDNAPAVVLIHGSGPNSRDEVLSGQLNMTFGFKIPVFAELGDALQQAGFAVLTYDKRTCGPFNGCADNGYPMPGDDITVDDFVTDAAAAVAFLRAQPEVDPARVFVVGHSQGAEFIPLLLQSDPELAGGVMLSGPYRPIDQLMEFQYDSSIDLMESLGMTEDQATSSAGMSDLAATLAGLQQIRDGSDEAVAGVSAAFWRSWFDLDEAKLAAVANVNQPVLILGGNYDWNVPPEEAQSWDTLFTDSGKAHTTAILDCVTHALNCVTETDITALGADDIGKHVADEVKTTLIDFLSS